MKSPTRKGFRSSISTPRKIAETPLHRETDRHAGGADKRYDACGVKAEVPRDDKHQQTVQTCLDQTVEKLYDACFHIGALERLLCYPAYEFDQLGSHEKQKRRKQHPHAKPERFLRQRIEEFFKCVQIFGDLVNI